MIVEPLPSYHPAPSRPRLRLPPLACDSHVHVLGPRARFPFARNRAFTPAEAPKERLFALHEKLGIERGIVVQSAAHGFDNFVVTDALAAKHGAYRGVALVPTDVPRLELRRLDALGFCGARVDLVAGRISIDRIAALSSRLAEVGWHLRVRADAAQLEELGARLRHSPVPVLVERMDRADASLLRLMDNPRFWAEVRDALPLARTLVAEHGDRVLWGSGWPHPGADSPPDDGRLVDRLADIAPGTDQFHALLVTNPQRLFRFDGQPRKSGTDHVFSRAPAGSRTRSGNPTPLRA